MNYNHFTINYLKAVKHYLKIEIDSNGNGLFFPELINGDDILNLKMELQAIWSSSDSAISIIETKHESKIQSGLFGIVNELDKALKIGFLLSDRVVLIDYLFERLLQKNPDKIDLSHLGVIASSLVATLPLAEAGRVVIIPNPFKWNPESKSIIKEVSEKTELTIELISLLNMLSITKRCNLHPYTIAESEINYLSIINNQIDKVYAIGNDGGNYAYESVLGALLSEKLLSDTELKVALNLPLSQYIDIISSNKKFYSEYLSLITAGGSLNGQNNIDKIKDLFRENAIEQNRSDIARLVRMGSFAGEVSGEAIVLASAVNVVTSSLLITGSVLVLSSILSKLFKSKGYAEQPIISVFNKLCN